jgi:acyl-CoA thioesterase YciA
VYAWETNTQLIVFAQSGGQMSTNDTGSALALRTVALPAFTNAHGDIFGGWLLSQMDLAGGTVATRLAEGRIVTVAVTEMSFQLPVLVGDEVTCFANVVKIGRSSIALKISAFARRGRTGEDIKVTEGLFTYVAVDAKGKSRPVQAHVATRKAAGVGRHSNGTPPAGEP